MANGLRVWDASGNLILDVTDRLTRILGYAYLPASSSSSLVDNGFLTGSPFYIAIRTNGSGTVFNGTSVAVSISFSGSTMFYSTSQSIADYIIVYGVY